MRPPAGLVFAHTAHEALIDRLRGPSQDREVRTRLALSFALLASCTSGSAPAPVAPEAPAAAQPPAPDAPVADAEPAQEEGETVAWSGPPRQGGSRHLVSPYFSLRSC